MCNLFVYIVSACVCFFPYPYEPVCHYLCLSLSKYVGKIVCVSMNLSRFESICVRVCQYVCASTSNSVYVCMCLHLSVSVGILYYFFYNFFPHQWLSQMNVYYSSNKYEIIIILISIWATYVNEHKGVHIISQTVVYGRIMW